MNSKKIQDLNPEIYEEFFKRCDIVCSCPGVFFWAGEHTVLSGAPALVQHIPLRVYVGLEEIRSKHFGIEYASESPIFDFIRLSYGEGGAYYNLYELSKIKGVITKLERLCLENRLNKTFKIYFLNELEPSMGCNWSGAFSGALATAIFILNEKLCERDLKKWKETSLEDLRYDEKFDSLFRFAWKIENVFHGGSASGYGPFCSIVHDGQPMLYMTSERSDKIGAKYPIKISDENERIINEIPYLGYPLKKLIRDLNWNNLCLGFISSGIPKDTASQIREKKDKILKNLKFIRDALAKSLFKETLLTSHPLIDGELRVKLDEIADEKEDPRYYFFRSQAFATLDVLAGLMHFLGEGEQYLEDLASAVKGAQGGLELLKLDWPKLKYISKIIFEIVKEEGWNKTAIKLTGGGGGGWVLFLTSGIFFPKIKEHFEVNKRQYEEQKICITWLLPEDGIDEEGVVLEKSWHKKPIIGYKKSLKSKEIAYARIWRSKMKDFAKGDPLTIKEYNEIEKMKDKIPFLIIKEKGLIRLYVYGSEKKIFKGNAYGILEFLIKRPGVDVDFLELRKKIWRRRKDLVEKAEQEISEGRINGSNYNKVQNQVKRAISYLNAYLKKYIGNSLVETSKGRARLKCEFEFYLIEKCI